MRFDRSLTVVLTLAAAVVAGRGRAKEEAPPAPKPAAPTNSATPVKRPTLLDKYVAAPDPSYKWRIEKRTETDDAVELIVGLTSQTWRTAAEVDQPVWRHWLTIVAPKKATSAVALLVISGGSSDAPAPESASDRIRGIARATGAVVAELTAVPNEPLEFFGDGHPREEDDLLAYSWKKCLETRDLTWAGQLPMAKSAVRAMDAVQEVLAAETKGPRVARFVVAGASKRGWTTWLAAAVDPRVVAIAPIVIDVLNVQKSMRHHHEVYGFWAPALDDYKNHGLLEILGLPDVAPLMAIVDPYSYRDRLTMPKCVINASGDEFFTPDSSRFYFDDLPGEKLLAYFPNAGHALAGTKAVDTLTAFFWSIVHDSPRPDVGWNFPKPGVLEVHCKPTPRRAVLWQANNPKARDFRFSEIGAAYSSEELTPTAPGEYTATVAPPALGFTAFFVQLEFDVGAPTPLFVSTPVKVIAAKGASRGG